MSDLGADKRQGPCREGEEPKPTMNGRGKSDPAIVAVKLANNAGKPVAEPMEPRAGAKGNADQQTTCRAQNRESVSHALERIREVARHKKKEKFTSLLHHVTIDLLRAAFVKLKRDAAPGVDGMTWKPTRSIARFVFRISIRGFTAGGIEHFPPAVGSYRRQMVANGHWLSPPWKTRSSNGR